MVLFQIFAVKQACLSAWEFGWWHSGFQRAHTHFDSLTLALRKHTHGVLPGNRRFPGALKVVTWQLPAFCHLLIPLSSPPCCHAFILFYCFLFFALYHPIPHSIALLTPFLPPALWGVTGLTSCWPQHWVEVGKLTIIKGSIAKMDAHSLELWLLLSHKIHPHWMLLSLLICGNNTELPAVRAAVKYKWFPHRSQIIFCVCVYPTTPWSYLVFVFAPSWVKTEGKQTKRQR